VAWSVPRTWVTGELVTGSIMNTHVRDNFNGVLPVGTLIMRAANYTTVETAVESRWLQCNGVEVSRTTYSVLFSYLNGLTPALPFGSGNGTTTFTLPDLRGRTVYAEGEHANVDVMGDSEGLAIASRGPHHYHTISAGDAGTQGNVGQDNTLDRGTPTANTSGTDGALNVPSYLTAGSYFIKYTS
jgi:microcystin-dependent protein